MPGGFPLGTMGRERTLGFPEVQPTMVLADRTRDRSRVEPPRRAGRPRDAQVGEAIVAATISLLARCPDPGSLSMDDIASHAGVGKASIYRRWPNKEALITSALGSINETVPDLPGESVRDDLRRLCVSLRSSMDSEEPGRLLPSVAALGRRQPELMGRYVRCVAGVRHRMIRDVLACGMATGEIRSDVDVDAAAGFVVNAMLSPSLLGVGAAGPAGETIDALLDLVLRGLCRDDGSTEP